MKFQRSLLNRRKPNLRHQRMYWTLQCTISGIGVFRDMTSVGTAVCYAHSTVRAVIEIFHKERGGKGVWKMIDQGTQIRVTKNVGKRVKLVTKVSVKFNRGDMQLRLLDLSDTANPQDGQCHLETVALKVRSI